MKKTRILFFIYQMGAGGAARTLLNIINNLDREKYAPVLVTLNFNGSYEKELKEDVQFIKLDTKRLSRSILQLAAIIREEKIDLVFSTIPRVNTIAIIAAKLSLTKVKVVIREADNLGGSPKENLLLLAFGMVYKLADQIISLSEGVKENLVQRYRVGADRIKVIYNPVDVRHIEKQITTGEIAAEHRHLFETGEKVLITAGRLVKQKDQHTMLHAFAAVNQKLAARLVILGEGPLKEDLLQEAEKLGVKDKVYFIGFQSNPYIYFSHADLFVLSSIHEGFSHVIAESLAAGTPVVTTDCKSGPAEVLENGKYGWLCAVGDWEEMADRILHVLTLSEKEHAHVVAAGCERAKHFDARRIVREYETTFQRTMQEQPLSG